MQNIKRFLLTDLLFLKVCIAFILGIVLAEYLPISTSIILVVCLGIILFVLYKYFKINRSKASDILTFSLISICGIGLHSYQIYPQSQIESSLLTFIEKEQVTHCIRLDEKPLIKENSLKLEGRLLKSFDDTIQQNFNAKIIIYVPKTTIIDTEYYGQIYYFKGRIVYPNRPHFDIEFNYKQWLNRHGIFATMYSKDFVLVSRDSSLWYRVKSIPYRIRDFYEQKIDQYVTEPTSNDIAKSILIGVRTDIDRELVDAYANTGTVHILSVSGFHFAILVYFLGLILNLLVKNEKYRFPIKHSFSLIYALMTGFSPPVIRSFLMLFLLDLEKFSFAKPSSFNILFLSACLILFFDTNQLFDVGFQLSYAALLGIMILYERIVWKIEFSHKISIWLWKCTASLFAAWLFTLPFTLYYFHKMTFLGMFSNYIVIPITTIAMYVGFVLLIVSGLRLETLSGYIGHSLSYLITLQNKIIIWFSQIKFAILDRYYLGKFELFVLIFALIFLVLFMRLRDKFSLRVFCFLIVIFIGLTSFFHYQRSQESCWYIAPSFKFVSLIYQSPHKIVVFSDTMEPNTRDHFIKKLKIKYDIDTVLRYSLSSRFENFPMEYGISLKSNPKQMILCVENKSEWDEIIEQRDSFILHPNFRYNKDELRQRLISKSKYFVEY